MTDIAVTTSETTVSVVSPTAATVNVTAGQDTVLINPPDLAYIHAFDTTSQTAASSTQVYKVDVNTTGLAYAIDRTDGTFTFTRAGTYSVTFSVQWLNTSTSIVETNLFVKKNSQYVFDSSSYTSVPNSHGGVAGQTITTVNFIMQFVSNDTLQFWWHSDNSACTIHTIAATTSPEMPRSPGVIITIAQVS